MRGLALTPPPSLPLPDVDTAAEAAAAVQAQMRARGLAPPSLEVHAPPLPPAGAEGGGGAPCELAVCADVAALLAEMQAEEEEEDAEEPTEEEAAATLGRALGPLAARLAPHGLLLLAQPPRAAASGALHAALRASPRMRAVALPSPDGDGGLVTLVMRADEAHA